MKNQMKTMIAIAAIALTAMACSTETMQQGKMTVHMTDAPGLYEQVNVEIVSVLAHYADSSQGDSGWVELTTNAGIYNLLELQNGLDTMLVDHDDVPIGKVTQLRLILGTQNNVMLLDSSYMDLQTSSQTNTGLKVNVNMDIDPAEDVEVLLDFDAEASIVVRGNGSLLLKPVIKVLKES